MVGKGIGQARLYGERAEGRETYSSSASHERSINGKREANESWKSTNNLCMWSCGRNAALNETVNLWYISKHVLNVVKTISELG